MASITIRGYEREDLPLAERLTSLGRRFPCLERAVGPINDCGRLGGARVI